jgi:hypothetical protein
MPSKKVTISQKIFIFLLLTVGIVFILLQVYHSVREGFQSTDDGVLCDRKEINGRPTYLCETKEAALSQIGNMDRTVDVDIAVCYTDIDTNNSNINGNFGIGASNLPTKFYICYDRPPLLVFDPTAGVMLSMLEIDDPQPDSATTSFRANCAAYNGAFQTYFNSYLKTSSILGSVNTIGFSNISSGINILSNVSTQRCIKSGDPKYIASNDIGSNLCRTFGLGISKFASISNDTGPSSLQELTKVISESKNLLSNEMYTVLKPAFLNSGCIADSDMAAYRKII